MIQKCKQDYFVFHISLYYDTFYTLTTLLKHKCNLIFNIYILFSLI